MPARNPLRHIVFLVVSAVMACALACGGDSGPAASTDSGGVADPGVSRDMGVSSDPCPDAGLQPADASIADAVEPGPSSSDAASDPAGAPDESFPLPDAAIPDAVETPDVPAPSDAGAPDDTAASDPGAPDDGPPPPTEDGTPDHPFIIPIVPGGPAWQDEGDTSASAVYLNDSYPPNTVDECGPEVHYAFETAVPVSLHAWIDFPEPAGVDVDLHLLASLDPLVLLERGHYDIQVDLAPGSYRLVMDTFCKAGTAYAGAYHLHVTTTAWSPGTLAQPVWLDGAGGAPLALPFAFNDERDTASAVSDAIDAYPPNTVDESGPEVVYAFSVDQEVRFFAYVEAPEPAGVDIDVHLLSSLEPLALIERDDKAIYRVLPAGTYRLVLDTYAGMTGTYRLHVAVRQATPPASALFNDWIVEAVDWLYANYGLLGYDSAALTHDIPYGATGLIEAMEPPRTMCVAAVMEVILIAMNLYAEGTGDASVFGFLPESSWENLKPSSIRAHIWVNHDLDSSGTADALAHFGMGYVVPFEELTPGAFVNLNRTTGTGHAVVFLGFVTSDGVVHDVYPAAGQVIGFKYFSSQGGFAAGTGGLDFRVAIFEDFGNPVLPGVTLKKDLHVVYSDDPYYLNTGVMLAPSGWLHLRAAPPPPCVASGTCRPSAFDPVYFDGSAAM